MEQRRICCGAPSHLVNLSSAVWLQSQLGCLRLLHQCHPIAAQSALLCCYLMIRSASSSSIGAPKIQLLLLQPSVGMPRCLRFLPLQEETQFVFFFFICCRQRKQASKWKSIVSFFNIKLHSQGKLHFSSFQLVHMQANI